MQKILHFIILFVFIFLSISAKAQFGLGGLVKPKSTGSSTNGAGNGRKSKSSGPPVVTIDSVTLAKQLNNIIEISDHDEAVKQEALTALKNHIKDELLPVVVLKFYALQSDWYIQNDPENTNEPKFKYEQFLYIFKNTKTGLCRAMIWSAIRYFDTGTWTYNKKLFFMPFAKAIQTAEAVLQLKVPYKTEAGTKDYITMTENQVYPLDCGTISK